MVEWLKPQPGEIILDAACSTALYARFLGQRVPGLNLHAVDLSFGFLQRAKAYAEREGIRLNLVEAEVGDLPYRDGVFDAIVCGGSLNEFIDLERTLFDLGRVLKPRGRLWLMLVQRSRNLFGRSLQALFQTTGLSFPCPETVSSIAATAGLKLIKQRRVVDIAFNLFEQWEKDDHLQTPEGPIKQVR
jgi:ubiquinone/menaquinone biosynthesis C-methylase UbiE